MTLRGVINSIKLTASMRLRKDDIVALKNIYAAAEFV